MTTSCLLVSDANIAPLAGYLRNDTESPQVQVIEAPYGIVEPVFLSEHEVWSRVEGDTAALVWTRPHSVVPALAQLEFGRAVYRDELAAGVDRFVELLLAKKDRLSALLLPLWTLPPTARNRGAGDLKRGGCQWAVQQMNARLVMLAEDSALIHLLDTHSMLASCAERVYDAKLWHMGKIPFANSVFRRAVGEVKAVLRALTGRAKKLIVLDLDDTLWGGSVGEVGWEQIRLGGHDYVGEAFVVFQQALKGLSSRGIILALASRNEERLALEAIDSHPDMVLRRDDFVAWQIHWGDKATSVASLASELNIGLSEVVFIDDHPAERARVREALPEVMVPEWPEDPALYADALAELRAFDALELSGEDGRRGALYAEERKRSASLREVESLEVWLESLELVVTAKKLMSDDIGRAAQLLNKTNQMNLRTRRMTGDQLASWAEGEDREVWTVRVADRFGDAGLCGLLGLKGREGRGDVTDYVLSCRVMGRGVEEALLHVATARAQANGWSSLRVEILPTEKNKPCRAVLERLLAERKRGENSWDLEGVFPLPQHVDMRM
ncbi:MAG: HAD-IIIC family phosphatase [Candidatus Latescibacterota bacterium]|nr:HAD-IIIC family phosphatase [Candidatus Latescibacterota bacterium]